MFNAEERELAAGDRIQWRLVSGELDLKNAERGTVERLDGQHATIRWDRGDRIQTIDLGRYKTWDHGYAETVYSAQSKTYARAYVLAPIGSPLVNGQNYYTAITRAKYGVKLWTEDENKLVAKLEQRSGEKTSALQGLGRLDRDHSLRILARHNDRMGWLKDEQMRDRQARSDVRLEKRLDDRNQERMGLSYRAAVSARSIFETLDRHLLEILGRGEGHGRDTSTAPLDRAPGAREREGKDGMDRKGPAAI